MASITPHLVSSGSAGLAWWRLHGAVNSSNPGGHPLGDEFLSNVHRHMAIQPRIGEAVQILHDAGIEPVLIKGWGVARLYPHPGMRSPGDIDLCVDPSVADAATRALLAADRPDVDLHAGPGRVLDRPFRTLLDEAQEIDVAGTRTRIPSLEHQLRLLARHLLRHGLWRPIWLCDLAMILDLRASLDWDEVLRGDRPGREWTAAILGVAREVLDPDPAVAPWQAITAPPWMIDLLYSEWGVPAARGRGETFVDRLAAPQASRLEVVRRQWPDPSRALFLMRAPLNSPRFPLQLAFAARKSRHLATQLYGRWRRPT